MIKEALDFINEEIQGCIMNIEFCKYKGYDSPLHDQRLIDLNNLKEEFEKLSDKAKKYDEKETPKKVFKESLADALCPICHCYINFDMLNDDFKYAPNYCYECGQKLDWEVEECLK